MYVHIVTNSHNRRYQRAYFFQPIESYWKDRQTEMLNSLQGKPLIVSGDGRCDSPGFSSMYCTYSLMDTETKLILHSETLKRSEVRLESTMSCNLDSNYIASVFYRFCQMLSSLHVHYGQGLF